MRTNPFRYIFGWAALLLFTVCAVSEGFAQNLNSGFGKNRVQYHKQQEEWKYYETPHLITYWYGDARNIAVTALQMAEYDYDEVQQLLEYQLSERIELLVFSDLTDLKQSNIGVDDLFQIRQGETKVSGNKVFVYYDGDHTHLRRSVREGLAGIIINAMLFGSSIQEIVQNSVLLNLPGWYTDGLKSYCGQDWSTTMDADLRNALTYGKYKTFAQLAKMEPVLAGHAFWHYIALHFGEGSISNLLYLTRINRGLDAGFRYVMGEGYETTTQTVLDYYRQRYKNDIQGTTPPKYPLKMSNKRKHPLFQPKVSPDGRYVAWVQNDIGKWKVYVQEIKSGKRRRVLKGGVRNALQATDYSYPLLAWSMDNKTLGILYESRDVPKLALLDRETGKKETKPISPEFQRVHSMDFVNPVDMVFSATSRGYTDLYIYHTINRQTERLTYDFWDDHDVSFLRRGDRRYLIFASNRIADTLAQERIDTILPLGKNDVFLFDLDTRSPELLRMTNTPYENERLPMALGADHFTWLTNKNGIDNRVTAQLEDYTAFYTVHYYLKSGAEVVALDTRKPGEWPIGKAIKIYPPADTVWKNLDTLQVDSIRYRSVVKQRAIHWASSHFPQSIQSMDFSSAAEPVGVYQFLEGKESRFYRIGWDSTVVQSVPFSYTLYGAAYLKSMGIEAGSLIKSEPDAPALSPEPEKADTIPVGWTFQVPEHLRQPAPASLPNESKESLPVEKNALNNAELLWHTKALGKKNKYIASQKSGVLRFNPSKIVGYRLRFRNDFVTTTMDNSLLFDGLNSYAGTPDNFRTPPMGVLVKANFKELLENYVVEAGMRLPITFDGSEFYMLMDDKKRRIDRRYALYRKTKVSNLDYPAPNNPLQGYQVRNNTVLGQYELRYPFSSFFSVRGTATVRQDKLITLTSDRQSLEVPDYSEQRAALRASAVYDNTVEVDMNLRTGSRAKVYVELVKRFAFNTQPKWELSLNEGFMTVVNADLRHYQKLDRYSILALRAAGATTFGSERILYYLGGVDNWLRPRFNQNIPVPQGENFAYETLAAHVRGFDQNIRNGSSFALVNAELRVPVFKYILNKPVLGPFWRNFQLTGFVDAGTAWSGGSPYDGNNPINTIDLQNPPVVYMQVRYFRDPVVAGYGAGIRLQLLGMLIRADYAWGIETRAIQKPRFYLALGTDF